MQSFIYAESEYPFFLGNKDIRFYENFHLNQDFFTNQTNFLTEKS
jgi:hypothetical protein